MARSMHCRWSPLVLAGQRYFEVVGARVLEGRVFEADGARARLERPSDGVVVNERFARMHFQSETVIGKRLTV